MSMSRRKAIGISGSTLAGLSLATLTADRLQAQAAQQPDALARSLVERPLRAGFPAPLPLNADGSAPEHPDSAAGPITDPLMWRTHASRPEIEFDPQKLAVKVDTRGSREAGRHAAFLGPREAPARLAHVSSCSAVRPTHVGS